MFETLPAELRASIYEYVFAKTGVLICLWVSHQFLPWTVISSKTGIPTQSIERCRPEEAWGLPEERVMTHSVKPSMHLKASILAVNKTIRWEAWPVLFKQRTIRFTPFQAHSLNGKLPIPDMLSHIQIEEYEPGRFIKLAPLLTKLLAGSNVRSVTVGANAAALFLVNATNSLEGRARIDALHKVNMLSHSVVHSSAVYRLTVPSWPKLSFVNFKKKAMLDMKSVDAKKYGLNIDVLESRWNEVAVVEMDLWYGAKKEVEEQVEEQVKDDDHDLSTLLSCSDPFSHRDADVGAEDETKSGYHSKS